MKNLLRVAATDITVGKPLSFDLMDQNGNVILRRGYRIESRRQFENLMEKGVYYEEDDALQKKDEAKEKSPQKLSPFESIPRMRSQLKQVLLNPEAQDDFPSALIRRPSCSP